MDLKNLSPADKDSAEAYLFGDAQPEVLPPITKPLTGEVKAEAGGDASVTIKPAKNTFANMDPRSLVRKYVRGEGSFEGALKGLQRDNTENIPNFNEAIQIVEDELHTKAKMESAGGDQYGAKNKIFTADAADRARALLKKKLSGTQLNSGLDPEIMQAGIQLAGYHIEAGARSFAAYSKSMVADIGEAIKPYLRSFYEGVRYYPGFDNHGMDSAADIDSKAAEAETETASSEQSEESPEVRVSNTVMARLRSGEKINSAKLFKWADQAYGGTQGQGAYTVKDAYDALELGVNKLIAGDPAYDPSNSSPEIAQNIVTALESITDLLPTRPNGPRSSRNTSNFPHPLPLALLLTGWPAPAKTMLFWNPAPEPGDWLYSPKTLEPG